MSAEICCDVGGGNLTFYDKRNLLVINHQINERRTVGDEKHYKSL